MSVDAVAVRPAFKLNLSSVLFSSAAEGGKSISAYDAALKEIRTTTSKEWKLTLENDTRGFAVTETAAEAAPGRTVTLNYTDAMVFNAETVPNEHISAILSDSNGELLYYGRLA